MHIRGLVEPSNGRVTGFDLVLRSNPSRRIVRSPRSVESVGGPRSAPQSPESRATRSTDRSRPSPIRETPGLKTNVGVPRRAGVNTYSPAGTSSQAPDAPSDRVSPAASMARWKAAVSSVCPSPWAPCSRTDTRTSSGAGSRGVGADGEPSDGGPSTHAESKPRPAREPATASTRLRLTLPLKGDRRCHQGTGIHGCPERIDC